jgi:hypothetical protein
MRRKQPTPRPIRIALRVGAAIAAIAILAVAAWGGHDLPGRIGIVFYGVLFAFMVLVIIAAALDLLLRMNAGIVEPGELLDDDKDDDHTSDAANPINITGLSGAEERMNHGSC